MNVAMGNSMQKCVSLNVDSFPERIMQHVAQALQVSVHIECSGYDLVYASRALCL